MINEFTELMTKRRSRYSLSAQSTLSDAKIEELLKECVRYTPSAFNSQSARVVLLLGKNHQKLWDITKEILRSKVPADKFAPTEKKIDSFAAAYASILYYDETDTIKALQEKFPTYKDNFPVWAEQANGMLQYAVWTSLAEAGMGASLQHYNPIIDEQVRETFNIPSSWKLIAQMPFGQSTAPDQPIDFIPPEQRVIIK